MDIQNVSEKTLKKMSKRDLNKRRKKILSAIDKATTLSQLEKLDKELVKVDRIRHEGL